MKKTSDKIFKILVIFCLVALVTGSVLKMYNNYTEKKAISNAIASVDNAFKGNSKYHKKTNRIVIEKSLKNEEELYNLTKEALPKLSSIGNYGVVYLLSVRVYYNGNKEDFQYYDIKFRDISKLNWNNINNFNDFLNYINVLSFN